MTKLLLLTIALLAAATAHAAPSADELRTCDIINAQRTANGVAPLRFSDEIYAAAKAHSDDLAAHGGNCDLHNSCNGEIWWKRVQRYYPGWVALAENVATNTADPEGIVVGWMASGPHRGNILNTNVTDVGCAITIGQTAFGKLAFATADFGSRGLLPVSTPTPGTSPSTTAVPTPTVVGVDRITLRRTGTTTTFNARLLVPASAMLDQLVALEIDEELVALVPADCIEVHGRGARSTCTGADVRITPAGLPRYRLRLRFSGQHVPTASVRLTAVGQVWDLKP